MASPCFTVPSSKHNAIPTDERHEEFCHEERRGLGYLEHEELTNHESPPSQTQPQQMIDTCSGRNVATTRTCGLCRGCAEHFSGMERAGMVAREQESRRRSIVNTPGLQWKTIALDRSR